MATTINSYSVKLGMDASGFVDATKISRSEARSLVKDIEAAQTPFEKFAVEQERLKRALDSGAISEGTYNRLLKDKKPGLDAVVASMNPYIVAIGAVTAGITAAGVGTAVFIKHMRDIQNVIDDAGDKAERLGVSFSDLKSLEFGFKEGGGVDAQVVGDSIKKLQINMAKAVEGDETLRAAFAKLGLDAGELIGKGPKQAMMSIADAMGDAMGGVNNHAERLKLSMEIFGKSGADLASTLGKGSDALESSAAFAEKWLGLTDQQVAMVGANNDAWDRIGIAIQGITQMIAAELAPAMEMVAQSIPTGAEGVDGISAGISNAVTVSVDFVGFMYDAAELTGEIYSRMAAIATLDFKNITREIDPSVGAFDTNEKLVQKLEERRLAARIAAQDAERRREEQRHAMRMEDTDKETRAKESAAKKVADEEERLRKQAEAEKRRFAEDALKNAEKYFEEERKRQMKLRDDVSKGPGSGMEAGSAEAARFMANQANAAIAEASVKVDAKPTDEQLVEEAKKQLEFLKKDAATKDKKLDKLVETMADNGWEAV